MNEHAIYLDSHATTRVDQDVLKTMLPYFTEHYGNGNHKAGWQTNSAVEEARFQVSSLIGARPSEVVFTSGATEAINMALLGLAQAHKGTRRHIVTQRTEHAAVLETIAALKNQGFEITMLDVDEVGRINLEELNEAVSEDTLVVAIMLANNEIGTVQPIKEIGKICRHVGTKFFCDITQGLGWYDIDVDDLKIDLAAFSSHKIYGPRGVGGLFVRRLKGKVNLKPITFGGGQERKLRPGTLNVPGIVGFGKACEILRINAGQHYKNIRALRDRLQDKIFSTLNGVKLNGCPINRHPGNLNISIPGVTGEELIGALPQVMFSTNSACSSGSAKPSHVITALGVEDFVQKSSFRFGFGKFNTVAEIDFVSEQIIEKAKQFQGRVGVLA